MTKQQVKLEVRPTGTETVDLIADRVPRYIEQLVKEDDKAELLANDEIQIEVEETFPTAEVVVIALTFLTQAAIEYWKYRLEKKLKEKYAVKITIEIPKDD